MKIHVWDNWRWKISKLDFWDILKEKERIITVTGMKLLTLEELQILERVSVCVCVWEFYFTKHLLFLINILKINTWEIFCCLSKTPNTQLLPSPKNITNIHQKGPFSMLIIKISDVTCICEERDLTQNSLELVILSSEINTF